MNNGTRDGMQDSVNAGTGAALRAVSKRAPRRWWLWLLVGALGLALLLTVALLLVAVTGVAALADYAQRGGSVLINGRAWDGLDMHAWGWDGADLGSGLALAITVAVVGLLLLVVPLCLVLAFGLTGAALGVALLAVVACLALAAALLLAPLWLMLMLLWWLLRGMQRSWAKSMSKPPAPTPSPSPTPSHSLG
jgi:hypothetical protein